MTLLHIIIRHPYSLYGAYSQYYEIVKIAPDRKTAQRFCTSKNNNLNSRYHYDIKTVRQ